MHPEVAEPATVKRTVLVIDDGLGMDKWFEGIAELLYANHGHDRASIGGEHVLPNLERTRECESILSMEDFLPDHADEVGAILLDCDLGRGGLRRSIELKDRARNGETPFGGRFREVPLAMITAQQDIQSIRERVCCQVFHKTDDLVDLVEWLASALRRNT